jgi:hypothetical protein
MVGESLSEGVVAGESDGMLGEVALGGAFDEELDGAVCAEATPANVIPARARISS